MMMKKIYQIILIFVIGSQYGIAYSNDIQTIRAPDGTVYTGEVVNGAPNGKGKATYTDGGTYEGSWKDGFWHGHGTEITAKKYKYVGNFKNGSKYGIGTQYMPSGSIYEGEWASNRRNGQGKYHYARNGKIIAEYVGSYKDHKRHGQGTITFLAKFEDGGIVRLPGENYKGGWINGKYHGTGTYTWMTGSKYVGDFRDGNITGFGKTTHPSGNEYEGEYKNGNQNGTGIFRYANGNRYEGEWINNNAHGQGMLYNSDGTRFTGEWKDGVLHGYGEAIFASGDEYKGEWKNGKKDGDNGAYYYKDLGIKAVGPWRNDVLHGKHKLYYADGTVTEAEFVRGKAVSAASTSKKPSTGVDDGSSTSSLGYSTEFTRVFFAATDYFLKSQELLLKAYGKNVEAEQVRSAIEYSKNSKVSESERLANSIKVSTEMSKIIERTMDDSSLALNDVAKGYYRKGLMPAARGVKTTILLIPAGKRIINSAEENPIAAFFELAAILTIIPEVPSYSSKMYQTMRLILNGAKAQKINGTENLEANLGDL